MKIILVTGSGGLIGSESVHFFCSLGFTVIGIDNNMRQVFFGEDGSTDWNQKRLLESYGERYIHHNVDIRDLKKITKIIDGKDIVFHLAAIVGVEETQLSPWEVLDVEVGGTMNIINAAAHAKVKKLIFGSSSEVYGDSEAAMHEDSKLAPRSTYAAAKLIGEEYCKAAQHEFGLNFTILRYFNIYGPRQDQRFVISRFIEKIIADEIITIYGDGKQTRDFTYIDDAITMTMLAATSDISNCQILNIGTEKSTSINDLLNTITSVMNKKNSIIKNFVEYDNIRSKEIEVFNRTASIAKCKTLLNYEPLISLETGINNLIKYYQP